MGARMDTFYAWCGVTRERNDEGSFRPECLIGFSRTHAPLRQQMLAMTLAQPIEPIVVSFVDRRSP